MRGKMRERFLRLIAFMQRHEKVARPALLALFVISLTVLLVYSSKILRRFNDGRFNSCDKCGGAAKPLPDFPVIPDYSKH